MRAMAEVSDATFVSRTGDVSEALRRTVQQANSWRQGLIDKRVIVSAGHGIVRFAIPYLRAYVGKPTGEEANSEQLEAWGVQIGVESIFLAPFAWCGGGVPAVFPPFSKQADFHARGGPSF